MKTSNDQRPLLIAAFAFIFAVPATAGAAEIDAQFNLGVGQSDNLLRTPNRQVDTGIGFLGAEISYADTGPKLNSDIVINADFLTYDSGSFDDEVIGGAAVVLDYLFTEESFSWNTQFNYGQQVFDPLVPIRPGNRENTSFLTTGPVLELPISDRNTLDVELNYSTVRYELRPNDNDRQNAQVGIRRDIGQGRTLALIASGERVEYDDLVLNPDFDRRELFFRWTTFSTRTAATFDIGYSELELDGVNVTSDGSVVRFDLTRVVSATTTFGIGGGSRFSDQGDIFRFQQVTQFDIRETEDVIGVATPFRNNFFNVSYTIERDRNGLNILANWSEEDYVDNDTLDREVLRISAFLDRRLTRKISGEFGIIYSSRDFQGLNRKDDDTLYQLSVGYDFSPAFTSSLSYQYLERSSTLAIDEFTENRVFLTLSYVPKWAR